MHYDSKYTSDPYKGMQSSMMRRPVLCWVLLPSTLLLLLVTVAGCDNTIDPFEEETGLFSIYGVLTLSGQPDLIRIRDLNNPHTDNAGGRLDATVTLENLTEGTSEVLQDSIIVYDGMHTYNYWTPTPVHPDTEYRLVVERADGATTMARATTPAILDIVAAPQGSHCLTTIHVDFLDVGSERLIDAAVGFRYRDELFWIRSSVDRASSTDARLSFQPEQILSTVIEDQDDPQTDGQYETRCSVLDEEQLHISYTHFGPDWLTVNVPLNPLESFDVDNGLGFFGALRTDSFTIPIDTSAVSMLL